MRNGVVSPAPRAMASTGSILSTTPKRLAVATILGMPTCMAMRTVMVLSDSSRPRRKTMGPWNLCFS